MIMKRFCHAILACGVFAAIVAAVSCTKDATGGGGGGYDGEPEVNHDMDGILRRNYLWNEEYATLSPDFGSSLLLAINLAAFFRVSWALAMA